MTIITPGIEARLCPQPGCGPDRHITRIPEGTVLTIISTEDYAIGSDFILDSPFAGYHRHWAGYLGGEVIYEIWRWDSRSHFPFNPTGLPMALFICLRHDLRAAAKLARAKTGRFPA